MGRQEYMALAAEFERQRQQGRDEGIRETAVEMLKNGIDYSVIVRCTHLSMQTIVKLAEQHLMAI
jgi:hypothetical protein